jgi:cholesterol transport system auxiliary component
MTSYTLVASGPPAAVAPAQVVPSAAASAGLGAQRGQRVLLLAPPQAAPGFDSARMVYQRHAQTFEAFTQSTWVDTPARMLTPLLQERLQASGLFRAVLQAPATSQADLRLETRVLQLQQSFLQQPGSVRFTLLATLSDNQTRTVLAWQRFDVTQATASEDAAGGAAAASLAVQSALDQLTAFVGTHMAALPPLGAAAAKP